MDCKICHAPSKFIFSAKILNKHDIRYFHCPQCGFLETEEPFWLEEAYLSSINMSDTGYLQRNIKLSKVTTVILTLFFNRKRKFLDYAGGYGVFVRLMRDIGFDFYWQDKYTQNLFARGFKWENEKVEAVTSFESFEHFDNPMQEIEKMLSISRNIIFTTELLPQPIPGPNDWWYYGLDHGQHISFYSEKTLKYIGKFFDLKYIHFRNLHLFVENKNISDMKIKLLKLNKLRLDEFFAKLFLKSLTWQDHLQISGRD